MAKNSETITVPFDLMKDEIALAVYKNGTYGWYPSLPCEVYLTNKRVVVKAIPVWGAIINKIIDFDLPFSKTKADIPLSAIREIRIKKLNSTIFDGTKKHVVFNKILHGKGDNMMNRIAEVIKDQYGRDVLAHD